MLMVWSTIHPLCVPLLRSSHSRLRCAPLARRTCCESTDVDDADGGEVADGDDPASVNVMTTTIGTSTRVPDECWSRARGSRSSPAPSHSSFVIVVRHIVSVYLALIAAARLNRATRRWMCD